MIEVKATKPSGEVAVFFVQSKDLDDFLKNEIVSHPQIYPLGTSIATRDVTLERAQKDEEFEREKVSVIVRKSELKRLSERAESGDLSNQDIKDAVRIILEVFKKSGEI